MFAFAILIADRVEAVIAIVWTFAIDNYYSMFILYKLLQTKLHCSYHGFNLKNLNFKKLFKEIMCFCNDFCSSFALEFVTI